MTPTKTLLAGVMAGSLLAGPATAAPIGEGIVMYMQMGGTAGDGATLARQTGAAQAAEALWAVPPSATSSREPSIRASR